MLDLFKKGPKTHAHSQSSPCWRGDTARSSEANPLSAEQKDLYDASFLASPPSPDDTKLIQPTSAHQGNFANVHVPEFSRPPLLTRKSDPELTVAGDVQQLELQNFAKSPEASPQQSPTKLKHLSFLNLKGDKPEARKKETQNRVLSGWFNGESTPINLGIVPSPTKENTDPFSVSTMASKPSQTTSTPKPTLSTRFSWLTTKPSPSSSKPNPPTDPADEFLTLDVSTALYPNGTPDTFSPASFKSHMQHAESLLNKLQAAYKQRTTALHELHAENETYAEERDGAETRSKCLRMQLNDMAAKMAEQDHVVIELVENLAEEKRLRREEQEARKRSVRVVKPSGAAPLSSASTTDVDSEDDESLFSKKSPRMSLSSVDTGGSPESYHAPELSVATAPTARLRGAQPTLVKSQPIADGCANCNGGSGAEAWNVVRLLKEENRVLKRRVEEVEGALEGCLDVVNRLS